MTRRVDSGQATSLVDLRKELLAALKTGKAVPRGAATFAEHRPLAAARVPFGLPVAKRRRDPRDAAAQEVVAQGLTPPRPRPHGQSKRAEPDTVAKAPDATGDLGQIAGLVGRCFALPELAALLSAGLRLAAAKIA